jgi:molybdopterin-guanine dinucleotide biosynthesis protein A
LILDHLLETFGNRFDEVIVVTNTPLSFLAWDLTLVSDVFEIRSSLTGIHAGLFYSRNAECFITACDTPLLRAPLLDLLLESRESHADVVIPETPEGLEPLCAIYSQRCLPAIENRLQRGDYRIRAFFPSVKVKRLETSILRQVDPELHSFANVNTPEDLARIEAQTG